MTSVSGRVLQCIFKSYRGTCSCSCRSTSRWNGESDGPELVDRANGEPVRTVAVQSRDGRTLDVRAVVYRDSSDTDSAAG